MNAHGARDLARAVNEKQFREDLFYRLAVLRVRVPSLRARTDDLPILVDHLLKQLLGKDEQRAQTIVGAMTDDHWDALKQHAWRGNVRELRNVIERAVATGTPPAPTADLSLAFEATEAASNSTEVFSLDEPFMAQKQVAIEQFERKYLAGIVARHQGNFTRAAAAAGIERMYFKRLLKKWGLTRENVLDD